MVYSGPWALRGLADKLEGLFRTVARHSSQDSDRLVAQWHSAQVSTVFSRRIELVPREIDNNAAVQSLSALPYSLVCLCALEGR